MKLIGAQPSIPFEMNLIFDATRGFGEPIPIEFLVTDSSVLPITVIGMIVQMRDENNTVMGSFRWAPNLPPNLPGLTAPSSFEACFTAADTYSKAIKLKHKSLLNLFILVSFVRKTLNNADELFIQPQWIPPPNFIHGQTPGSGTPHRIK